jgi:23S rRNA pseudouridine1911/1915/1917 synthase
LPSKSKPFLPPKRTNSNLTHHPMPGDPGLFTLEVTPHEKGLRTDAFVSAHLPDCSRSRAAALIRQGAIQVDGLPCKAGYRLKAGQTVHGRIPPPTAPDMLPEPLPLDILFEDPALIVVNKPAGLVVHPAAGHASGTLVNALLHHCPDLEGIGGERRPGIVHRLDKDTSGVMVVAKNDPAHQALSRQFKERRIRKRYLALVHGSPAADSGCIDLPVGRHAVERKKMAVVPSGGREARTVWHVRERFAAATLLALDLETGRTHQIRVHCLAMGHPIVGDPVYGRRRAARSRSGIDAPLHAIFRKAGRQMLHAARLGFTHPLSGEPLTFEAPLPADMAGVIRQLRELAA